MSSRFSGVLCRRFELWRSTTDSRDVALEIDGVRGRVLRVLYVVGHGAKRDRVRLVDGFLFGLSVGERAGNLRDFGNPAPIGFELSLYDESQVLTPCALRRFAFGTHILRMPDTEVGFQLTNVTTADGKAYIKNPEMQAPDWVRAVCESRLAKVFHRPRSFRCDI